MFDLMDKDKGGTLGAEEIKQLMDMLGMKVGGRELGGAEAGLSALGIA